MDYETLYVNLLEKHGTEAKPEGYSERHHVIPKWMGGDDSSLNLVYVSARVHFIAHFILYKMCRDEKSARALYGMCDLKRRPERFTVINSRRYEIAKKAFSVHNHMKLPEYRTYFSNKTTGQWRDGYDRMKASNAFMFKDENHPMYMKGKFGDDHPRSKAVVTPLGRFGSVREAGRAHGVPHYVISRYCKSDKYPDFNYC